MIIGTVFNAFLIDNHHDYFIQLLLHKRSLHLSASVMLFFPVLMISFSSSPHLLYHVLFVSNLGSLMSLYRLIPILGTVLRRVFLW